MKITRGQIWKQGILAFFRLSRVYEICNGSSSLKKLMQNGEVYDSLLNRKIKSAQCINPNDLISKVKIHWWTWGIYLLSISWSVSVGLSACKQGWYCTCISTRGNFSGGGKEVHQRRACKGCHRVGVRRRSPQDAGELLKFLKIQRKICLIILSENLQFFKFLSNFSRK